MADYFKITCGLVCEIHLSAMGKLSAKNAANHLIKDTEVISELVQRKNLWMSKFARDIDNRWHQCDYMLHALIWTLRDMDCGEVLKDMSKDSIRILKNTLLAVQDYERPNKRDADVVADVYYRKAQKQNMAPLVKQEYNVVRFSSFITSTVAAHWDEVTAEVKKWMDVLEMRQNARTEVSKAEEQPVAQVEKQLVVDPIKEVEIQTPAKPIAVPRKPREKSIKQEEKTDEELWTTKRLAQELGFKNVMSFHTTKYYVLKKNPDAAAKFDEWFSGSTPGKKRPLFKAKYFEDLKQLFGGRDKARIEPDVKQKIKVADANEADGELWTLVQLADKLKMPNVTVLYAKKSACIARNQDLAEQINGWFVKHGNRRYFKAKHFDELKDLFAKAKNMQPAIKVDEASEINDELWSLNRLAKELGLRDAIMFSKKKTVFLNKHKDIADNVNGWFVKRGKSRYFMAEHFEELKALFGSPKNIPGHDEVMEKESGAPMVSMVISAETQSTEPGNNALIQEQIADTKDDGGEANCNVVTEQKIDLTGAQGIKVYSAYLDELRKLYSAEYQKKWQNEKQHKELVAQAQLLQDAISESAKKLELLSGTISETEELLKTKTAAEEAKQNAENIIKAADARMMQLLQSQNEIEKQ